jgi:hypothetical protein
MRYSDPKLTAKIYTDPKLLDVHGALDALPSLPLDSWPTAEREQALATGTGAFGPRAFALPVALNSDNGAKFVAIGDKTKAESPNRIGSACHKSSDIRRYRYVSRDFGERLVNTPGRI